MRKTMFIGVVLTAAAVGTAWSAMPGVERDFDRAAGVTHGDWFECAGDTREWTPRTLKDGGGSAGLSDASPGEEEFPKQGIMARNCALV